MLSRHPLRRSIGRRIVARIDTVTWRGRLAAYSCGWLELKDASVMDPVTGATGAGDRIHYAGVLEFQPSA